MVILSICVPTYNRKSLLERNVSFHLEEFRRSGLSFEIVIVDDCSNDETPAYLSELKKEKEVRPFRRTKNSGFIRNYAFAMQRAKGKYALFLGDDDLLIPQRVIEYIQIMERDPQIGVIQAPWLLIDERGGANRQIGPFYLLPGPVRHKREDFRSLLNMILEYHVFPEFMIIRREVLVRAISSPTPFIFWAFLYTTRALEWGDILFLPDPFVRVTAASDDANLQQGNKECMFEWDRYRGGIEYLLSRAIRSQTLPPEERSYAHRRLNEFMIQRQLVALKLHVLAKNWSEAYVLYHRIAAYSVTGLPEEVYLKICKMAGFQTAAQEAAEYHDGQIIIDPQIEQSLISVLPYDVRNRILYEPQMDGDSQSAGTPYLRFDPAFPSECCPDDGIFDIPHYLAQFR